MKQRHKLHRHGVCYLDGWRCVLCRRVRLKPQRVAEARAVARHLQPDDNTHMTTSRPTHAPRPAQIQVRHMTLTPGTKCHFLLELPSRLRTPPSPHGAVTVAAHSFFSAKEGHALLCSRPRVRSCCALAGNNPHIGPSQGPTLPWPLLTAS